MNTLNTDEVSETLFDTVEEISIKTGSDPFLETDNPFGDDTDEVTPEVPEVEEVPEVAPVKKVKPKEDVLLKVEAGKSILKYLAERKGVADQIDFDTITSEDHIADFIEAIEEFDEANAFERIKSTNKDLKKVVEYLQAGGDSSKISKLLIEQEEVLEADVTTEDGAKSLLKQYYKNVLGFDDDVITKRIKKFTENGQLQEEAEDIKPLYDKNIEQRQQKLIEQAQRDKEKEKILLKQKQQDFVKILQENKVSKAVAQSYWDVAFNHRVLEDGTKIGEIDYKFQVMQRDPKQYLKLVEFLADPNLYDKQILQNKSNKEVQQQHNKRISFSSNKSPEVDESTKDIKPKFKF